MSPQGEDEVAEKQTEGRDAIMSPQGEDEVDEKQTEVGEKQSIDVIDDKPKKDHEEKANDGHGEPAPNKRMPLFSRPQQRHRWGQVQGHPHKDWGDIFFDLFYVAA
jgi:hypothetical protein